MYTICYILECTPYIANSLKTARSTSGALPFLAMDEHSNLRYLLGLINFLRKIKSLAVRQRLNKNARLDQNPPPLESNHDPVHNYHRRHPRQNLLRC